MTQPTITPFLWYDNNAQDAAAFYTSVFPTTKIISSSPVITEVELQGQRLLFLNGGPHFRHTEAFSLFVGCETQAEIDDYWEKLQADGGSPSQCGWLKDKFGLSWQIVPNVLGKLLGSSDRAASKRAMDAMLSMTKLDIAQLQRAYDGA
jgi:predicted 3-demethylubiquinone-9 3-methyltransferase (glyoxalase superfamily)